MASFVEKKLAEHGIDARTGKKTKTEKSKVKKYDSTYRVPLAYVGLLEMNEDPRESNGDFNKTYRGKMGFQTDVGQGTVRTSMYIRGDKDAPYSDYDPKAEEMYNRFKTDPTDVEAETYYQNYKLREENAKDFLSISVSGFLTYEIETPKGKRTPYEAKSPSFRSVEDYLAWVESSSQDAWSDVTIAVNDLRGELAEFAQGEATLPSDIVIDTGTALGTVKLEIDSAIRSYDTDQYINDPGYLAGKSMTEQNVTVEILCGILPIQNPDAQGFGRGGGRTADWTSDVKNRTFVPSSYQVVCIGTIVDENTQISARRNNPKQETWVRDFGYQGALALDDAKQILVQNIQEVMQEWNEYVASERVYEEHGHGVGYARTTDQMSPWDYNFGDTLDDANYDEYQSRELLERIRRDINNVTGEGVRVEAKGDGTYAVTVDLGAGYGVRSNADFDDEQYLQQAIDAFQTTLQSNGYEVMSYSAQSSYGSVRYFEFIVKPVVAKAMKMKKSISKKFEMLKKGKVVKNENGEGYYNEYIYQGGGSIDDNLRNAMEFVGARDITSGLIQALEDYGMSRSQACDKAKAIIEFALANGTTLLTEADLKGL